MRKQRRLRVWDLAWLWVGDFEQMSLDALLEDEDSLRVTDGFGERVPESRSNALSPKPLSLDLGIIKVHMAES